MARLEWEKRQALQKARRKEKPATQRQLDYLGKLLDNSDWVPKDLTARQASRMIGQLKASTPKAWRNRLG